MTISNTKTQEKYQGDGTTVQWNIPFVFNSKDDLEIYVISSDGTISRVTEDYAVDEVSKILYYPLQNNGASALPSDKTLLIRRNTALLQQVNFDAQSDIPKSVLENSYDKAMMIAQELSEQIGRAVKFPLGTTDGQTDAAAYLNTISSAVTTAQTAASTAQSAASTAAADAQASINSYTDTAVGAEKSAREAADALKLDITAATSTYLSQSDAADTYLTKAAAQSTYLTQTAAASDYLTQEDASSTYLAQSDAQSTYLSQSDAASTYLSQTSAASTYLTQANAASTYMPKSAIDSALSDSSENPVQNKVITKTLDERIPVPWQKPASWPDIRNGAIQNSAYYLVAHAVPTESEGVYTIASYPSFTVKATLSTAANSYDVYVDGIKVATTVSGTATVIDWATLYNNATITDGFEISYPSDMIAHIVRVSPAVSSDTITGLTCNGTYTNPSKQTGILWCHLLITDWFNATNFLGSNGDYSCRLLEAVTSSTGGITVASLESAFNDCRALKEVPVISSRDSALNMWGSFNHCDVLEKVSFNNVVAAANNAYSMNNCFLYCTKIESITGLTGDLSSNAFNGCNKLKKLPNITITNSVQGTNAATNMISLEDTYLDLSNHTTKRTIGLHGESGKRMDGLKGLVVSSSAPFDGNSPQIDVSYTGLDRAALVKLFNSLPTVTGSQVINVTAAIGAADLTVSDLAIATDKGWTVTR